MCFATFGFHVYCFQAVRLRRSLPANSRPYSGANSPPKHLRLVADALGVGGARNMNQLATAALHDQSRHQRASRYEQQWQGAYGRLQVRQPTTRISAGADAFAETVLLAQQAARQSKISDSDSGPTGHAATHRQLMGMKPGGGPRQWVAGVAPTTKGAPTRSLMMRLPTEGGAAELSVPARPAQHVENDVKPRGDAHVPPTPPPNWAYACGFPTQAQMARLRGEQGGGHARNGGGGRWSALADAARRGAAAAPREWRLAAAHATESAERRPSAW